MEVNRRQNSLQSKKGMCNSHKEKSPFKNMGMSFLFGEVFKQVWVITQKGNVGMCGGSDEAALKLGFPLAKGFQQLLYQQNCSPLFLIPLTIAGNRFCPYASSVCHNDKCLGSQGWMNFPGQQYKDL